MFISSRIYSQQRSSSRIRGHAEPTYSLSELRTWLNDQPRYQSLRLIHEIKSRYGHDKLSSPSIDRIDDSRGYSFDNIQLVTWGENKEKENKVKSKPIEQLDLDGNLIKEWCSIAEAKRELGLNHISRACNGKAITNGGYKWRFHK